MPMADKECHCGDPVQHAKAAEEGIFQSLQNASAGNEAYWRKHADLLEQKFTTGHGRHYSHFIYPQPTSGANEGVG